MASRAEIIKAVCADNADAQRFCVALVDYLHWIDDTVDRDNPLTPAESVRINLSAVDEISSNPFFQQNKQALSTLLVQAFRAWADSCQWAQRLDVRDQRAADVLKSAYHEILWHVAYLVGGWGHLSAVTQQYRHFDYDFRG